MDFLEQLTEDIKTAMKARDSLRLDALRGVKKELLEAKTAKGASGEIADADVTRILQKMVKQRRDAAAIFTQQGREDLAGKENAEADVISVYLPAAMSPAELETALKEIIARTGASSAKEIGKVMGVASKELAGKADGKDISETAKRLLNS